MRFLHADTTQEQANTVTALEEAAALDQAQGDASRSLSASLLCWADSFPPPTKRFILWVQGYYHSNVGKLSWSLEKAFFLTKAAAAFQTTQTMQVSSLLRPSHN